MIYIKKIVNILDKINLFIAEKQALILSSMYFYWICVCIDLSQLLLQPPRTVQEWCIFASQTCIQLLALPVLAFINDISTCKIINLLTDIWNWMKEDRVERAEMHKLLLETINELKELKVLENEELKKLDELEDNV